VTHESVITLLDDTAKSLGDSVQFGYGALEDFNTIPNKTFPYVWVFPMKGEFAKQGQNVGSIVEFDIEVNFIVLDSVTGNDYETAKAWDDAFQLMEKFAHKLDQFVNVACCLIFLTSFFFKDSEPFSPSSSFILSFASPVAIICACRSLGAFFNATSNLSERDLTSGA